MTDEEKKRHREANRRHYAKSRATIIAKVRKWQAANPEKKRKADFRFEDNRPARERIYDPGVREVYNAVQKAVGNGTLPKVRACVCADCPKQAEHYHHKDYAKPLEVEPLCTSCHRARHKKG